MLARPAGFSSEEEDDDFFSGNVAEIQSTNTEVVKSSFQREESSENTFDSLYYAIVCGDLEALMKIYDNEKIDVNVKLPDDSTLLLVAASVGNPEIVDFLINKGADVNITKDMYSPLMAACNCPSTTSSFDKSFEVVQKLVECKADPNAVNRKRMTPIMFAACSGNDDVLKYLLPLTDNNAEDNQGWTALFWAIESNNANIVKILLQAGYKSDKLDVRINTPLQYALNGENEEIIKLLPAKKSNKNIFIVQNIPYELDAIFNKNKKPSFRRDMDCLLHGMLCEQLCTLFQNSDINLEDFLSLTEDDLINKGIEMPYQRYRILKGLFRFHKESFKIKSIPKCAKYDEYSTLDIAKSILAAFRHLVVMTSSLKYLQVRSTTDIFEDSIIQNKVAQLKSLVVKLESTIALLKETSTKWDKDNRPVDLITVHSRRKGTNIIKWIPLLGITCVGFIMLKKYNI